MLLPIALCFAALLQGLAALGSPLAVAQHNDAGSTAASQTAADRSTAASQTAADRSTAASQTAADRSTAVSQTAADRSTAVSQTAEDRSTAASQTATDRSTAVSQTATDRSTAASQTATDRSTAVSQTAADRSTAVSQTAADRSTAVSQTATDKSTAVSQTATDRSTAVSQTATDRSTASSTTASIITQDVTASLAMQPVTLLVNSTEIAPSLTLAITATSTSVANAAMSEGTLQTVTNASSDMLGHSVTPQTLSSSALSSLLSMNRRQNDSVIFMSATVSSEASEGTTVGTQSEVLMTSTFMVSTVTAVLSTSRGTYHSGDSTTYQGFPSSTQPPVNLADSTPSPHDIISSDVLQTSSHIPPVAVSSSTLTPSHISLDTNIFETILSHSSTERLPSETETPHLEPLHSVSSTVSITRAAVPIITSPIISPVTEPSPRVQTSSAFDTIRTSPTQTYSNTASVSAQSNKSTESDVSENLNQSQGPYAESVPNVWSQSSAISSTKMLPSSSRSVTQYSSSAQFSSSSKSEGVTVMDGSNGPLPATEGREGGVEGGRSGGRHLSPGQKTALGICLTVVSMALIFAGFVIYKRRTQVGRWKLLDKSLRYRYWSYTHDCHQDDEIL